LLTGQYVKNEESGKPRLLTGQYVKNEESGKLRLLTGQYIKNEESGKPWLLTGQYNKKLLINRSTLMKPLTRRKFISRTASAGGAVLITPYLSGCLSSQNKMEKTGYFEA
jgi:hypothetical protein